MAAIEPFLTKFTLASYFIVSKYSKNFLKYDKSFVAGPMDCTWVLCVSAHCYQYVR